jgi:hypothetical protein
MSKVPNANKYTTIKTTHEKPKTTKSQGKKGGCFVATAVYGSYDAPSAIVLRKFRDAYLQNNRIGRWFVKAYNCYSPPLAAWLSTKPILKFIVRINLFYIVLFSRLIVRFGDKSVE